MDILRQFLLQALMTHTVARRHEANKQIHNISQENLTQDDYTGYRFISKDNIKTGLMETGRAGIAVSVYRVDYRLDDRGIRF